MGVHEWWCCQCTNGPYLLALYPACIACHHGRCYYCVPEGSFSPGSEAENKTATIDERISSNTENQDATRFDARIDTISLSDLSQEEGESTSRINPTDSLNMDDYHDTETARPAVAQHVMHHQSDVDFDDQLFQTLVESLDGVEKRKSLKHQLAMSLDTIQARPQPEGELASAFHSLSRPSDCLTAIKSLIQAISLLEKEDCVTGSYCILIVDPSRERVVRGKSIERMAIEKTRILLELFFQAPDAASERAAIHEIESILSPLKIDYTSKSYWSFVSYLYLTS